MQQVIGYGTLLLGTCGAAIEMMALGFTPITGAFALLFLMVVTGKAEEYLLQSRGRPRP